MKFDTFTSTINEKKGLWDNMHARRKAGKPKRKPGDKNYPKTLNVEQTCGKGEYFCNDDQKCKPIPEGHKVKADGELVSESAAWTRKEGKNKSGGLNEKGRKSYERANPGSDLKAPSKKKGNKRRSSFCARMKGMKKKLTSAKTARDPDSRINKSLRAWNCEYEWELDLLEDAKMGRQSDDKLAAAHKRFSGMDQSSPANKFMLKRIEKEQSRRKKLSEHHQKDENGKVIEHDEVEETPDQQIINPAQPWDQLDEVVHQSQRPSNLKKKAKLAAALNRLQDLKVASKMKEEYVKMTKKAYNKIHKDFKSDDPKNPRTTRYVKGKGTVSSPVKFVDEAKVDKLVPDHKRSGKRLERYGNPHGSLALGGGIQRDRRADHAERRGKKTKGVKEGMYDVDPKTGESPVAKSVRKGNKLDGDKRLKHFSKLAKKMIGEKIKYDKSGSSMDYFLGPDPKKTKYYKDTVKKKTKKEEVEHIDELNFDTLSSYVRKAYKDQRETGKDRRADHEARRGVKKEEVVNEKIKYDKSGSSMDYFLGPDPKKTKYYKDTVKKKTKKEEYVSEKKMVKVKLKDPSKIKVKVTDIGAGGKEYVRKNEMDEGTSYGIYKGTGKPSGAMAAYLKNKKKKDKEKKLVKAEEYFVGTVRDTRWEEDHLDEVLGYAAQIAGGMVRDGVRGLSNPDIKPGKDTVKKLKTQAAEKKQTGGGASAVKSKQDADRQAALKKQKDDRRDRAKKILTADKAAKKKVKQSDTGQSLRDGEAGGAPNAKPMTAEQVKRDEYGDPIGGPKISKKQLKRNLARNEKDEKIVRSEQMDPKPAAGGGKPMTKGQQKQIEGKKKQQNMIKKQILMKKLMAVRAGADGVAS